MTSPTEPSPVHLLPWAFLERSTFADNPLRCRGYGSYGDMPSTVPGMEPSPSRYWVFMFNHPPPTLPSPGGREGKACLGKESER